MENTLAIRELIERRNIPGGDIPEGKSERSCMEIR